MTRRVLTTNGWQEVTRRRLVAYDDEDHPGSVAACVKATGSASVYPLDCFLGIDRLPFRATADAALAIALAGATCPSYRDAAARLRDDLGASLSDVFVREVTEYVGEIVLWDDRDRAEAAVAAHDPAAIRSSRRGRRPKGGFTLFAMADGAMADTRAEGGGTAWRENKLGVVFRSDRLVERTLDDGTVERRIGEREYVCTTEGIGAFGPRLLRAMLDNGL